MNYFLPKMPIYNFFKFAATFFIFLKPENKEVKECFLKLA